MLIFVIGLSVFLGMHSISIASRSWRDGMIARLGEARWKGVYTIVSLASFALLCYGYGLTRAEATVLYTPPAFLRHVAFLLLLPVFPLLLSVYLPGQIKAKAKHPLLLATKLWAIAHLLVNGNLADVLLFGSFLVWALADRLSVTQRPQVVVIGGPHATRNDLIALGAGLALYGVFVVWLHRLLIGVALI